MKKVGKVKVIEFVSSMGMGGAETLVKDYVTTLERTRFDPMVVSVRGRSETPNEKAIDAYGVRSVYLLDEVTSFAFLPSRVRDVLRDRLCTLKLLWIIRKEQPDVLHIHMSEYRIAKLARLIPKHTSVFIHVHSTPEASVVRTGQVGAINKLIRVCRARLIALQPQYIETLNALFHVTDTILLPNCIDLKRFQTPEKSSVEMRAELGIPADAFVVGHVGRFQPVKNHSFLVDIFEQISKLRDNAWLLLVGDGPLKEETISMLTKKGFRGQCRTLSNRGDIPELLQAMDVFILPSLHEGFPVALMEAQAAGLRCVVSDTITPTVYLSKNLVPLSLELSAERWAEQAVGYDTIDVSTGDIKDFDRSVIVNQLETIYLEAVGKNGRNKDCNTD